MKHLVLLGDSIFDNAAYVEGEPALIEQVQSHLAAAGRATLLALDGAVVADVDSQCRRMPDDSTHLVLSVGGNDALRVVPQLHSPEALSMMGALNVLAQLQQRFESQYLRLLDGLAALQLPVVVCTIYDQVPGLEPQLRTALSLFNDVIVRAAFRKGFRILDLRLVCTEAADYSAVSPIEPSSAGGEKIAARLVQLLLGT